MIEFFINYNSNFIDLFFNNNYILIIDKLSNYLQFLDLISYIFFFLLDLINLVIEIFIELARRLCEQMPLEWYDNPKWLIGFLTGVTITVLTLIEIISQLRLIQRLLHKFRHPNGYGVDCEFCDEPEEQSESDVTFDNDPPEF